MLRVYPINFYMISLTLACVFYLAQLVVEYVVVE